MEECPLVRDSVTLNWTSPFECAKLKAIRYCINIIRTDGLVEYQNQCCKENKIYDEMKLDSYMITTIRTVL